jgi:hypothetical protein
VVPCRLVGERGSAGRFAMTTRGRRLGSQAALQAGSAWGSKCSLFFLKEKCRDFARLNATLYFQPVATSSVFRMDWSGTPLSVNTTMLSRVCSRR